MSGLNPNVPLSVDIKPTFGYVFIGLLASAVFYGITVMQTLFYFRTYENDHVFLRSLVMILWALDTLSIAMVSHGMYTWVITNYANPLGLNAVIWTVVVEPLCTATIAFLVHLFMAYRIRTLNKKMQPLAIAIAFISMLPFAMGITAVVFGLTTSGSFAVINTKLHWVTITANVSTAAIDIIIAAVLCLQLYAYSQSEDTFKQTSKMITMLNVYLITSNLLTSIITTCGLITFFAAPTTLVYEGINVIVSKAYTNTFLAQLNARDSIRGRGVNSTIRSQANIGSVMEFRVAPFGEGKGSTTMHESDVNQSVELQDVSAPKQRAFKLERE